MLLVFQIDECLLKQLFIHKYFQIIITWPFYPVTVLIITGVKYPHDLNLHIRAIRTFQFGKLDYITQNHIQLGHGPLAQDHWNGPILQQLVAAILPGKDFDVIRDPGQGCDTHRFCRGLIPSGLNKISPQFGSLIQGYEIFLVHPQRLGRFLCCILHIYKIFLVSLSCIHRRLKCNDAWIGIFLLDIC